MTPPATPEPTSRSAARRASRRSRSRCRARCRRCPPRSRCRYTAGVAPLRRGGCGGAAQLVRASAWERFGESRLASLYAGLQLKFHTCADWRAAAPPPTPNHAQPAGGGGGGGGAGAAGRGRRGRRRGRRGRGRRGRCGGPRASPTFGHEAAAVDARPRARRVRSRATPSRSRGGGRAARAPVAARPVRHAAAGDRLQHTGDVLVRGALLRGERRRRGVRAAARAPPRGRRAGRRAVGARARAADAKGRAGRGAARGGRARRRRGSRRRTRR